MKEASGFWVFLICSLENLTTELDAHSAEVCLMILIFLFCACPVMGRFVKLIIKIIEVKRTCPFSFLLDSHHDRLKYP